MAWGASYSATVRFRFPEGRSSFVNAGFFVRGSGSVWRYVDHPSEIRGRFVDGRLGRIAGRVLVCRKRRYSSIRSDQKGSDRNVCSARMLG